MITIILTRHKHKWPHFWDISINLTSFLMLTMLAGHWPSAYRHRSGAHAGRTTTKMHGGKPLCHHRQQHALQPVSHHSSSSRCPPGQWRWGWQTCDGDGGRGLGAELDDGAHDGALHEVCTRQLWLAILHVRKPLHWIVSTVCSLQVCILTGF